MVIVNNLNKLVTFGEVKVGECFIYDNSLYIRISPIGRDTRAINALCFTDYIPVFMHPDWHVTPVHAVVTINTKVVEDENY